MRPAPNHVLENRFLPVQGLTQPGLVAVLAIVLGVCVAAGVFLIAMHMTAGAESIASVPRVLISLLVGLGALAGAALFAVAVGVPFDRAAYTGFGLLVAAGTLLRPTWFWEHPRARAVRSILGDGGTVVFYLVVAAALLYVGLFTSWSFGRHR